MAATFATTTSDDFRSTSLHIQNAVVFPLCSRNDMHILVRESRNRQYPPGSIIRIRGLYVLEGGSLKSHDHYEKHGSVYIEWSPERFSVIDIPPQFNQSFYSTSFCSKLVVYSVYCLLSIMKIISSAPGALSMAVKNINQPPSHVLLHHQL